MVVRGVDADGDATQCFFFIFFCNVVPVGPTVAAKRTGKLTYFHFRFSNRNEKNSRTSFLACVTNVLVEEA